MMKMKMSEIVSTSTRSSRRREAWTRVSHVSDLIRNTNTNTNIKPKDKDKDKERA